MQNPPNPPLQGGASALDAPPFQGGVGGGYKISEPISRHKKDPRIWVAGRGIGERLTKKDAETTFEVVKSPPSPLFRKEGEQNILENTTLLKLFPKTGRTHQLRLHCRFIGHPIVGDVKYGINGITNEHGTQQIDALLPLLLMEGLGVVKQDRESRLMLHSKSLEFIHPVTGEKIKIETELPNDFKF